MISGSRVVASAARIRRFSASDPCPVCGGHPGLPRGQGVRCAGFISSDGRYVHCTRPEAAGTLAADKAEPPTYAHLATGDCRCGQVHGEPFARYKPPAASNGHKHTRKAISRLEYVVRDFDGQVQGTQHVTRYDDGTKDPFWTGPHGESGAGALGGADTGDMLFGAEQVGVWDPETAVVMTEGPKAASALIEAGIPAVGTVCGAGVKARPRALTARVAAGLVGRPVYLWPDADPDGLGHAHMEANACALSDAGCTDIRIIDWEDAPPKGDAADFLNGSDATGVMELMTAAKPWTPGAAAAPPMAGVGESHPLTDLRNGERFVSRHGVDVRYCRPWRRWLTWSGHRWEEDSDVEALAKETAIAIWDEAKTSNSKEFSSWAIRSQSTASIAGMLTMARSEPAVSLAVKDLDTDPWLLNTPSGTIDLRTGTLTPSRREDLITKITAASFDPDAGCPRWERFLEEVFTKADLTPDRDLIEYIRRLVGYSLTGSVREQMLAILYGTGRNGKGVFTNTLRYMLGDYGWVTPAELLLSKRSDAHPTGLAALWGRRVVVSAETDQGRRLDESLIKNLTGGDPIAARRMREDYWEFAPEFKLMLATNYKPEIRGTDEGIWRRIHCIPFLRTIDPADADDSLEDTLRDEWPGILAWAVRGCLAWQDGGLCPPGAVVEATRSYRREQDAIQRFIDECCDTSSRLEQVAAAKLYNAYKAWCETTGEHQVTATVFGTELNTRGFTKDLQRIATIPTVIRRHIRLNEGA